MNLLERMAKIDNAKYRSLTIRIKSLQDSLQEIYKRQIVEPWFKDHHEARIYMIEKEIELLDKERNELVHWVKDGNSIVSQD